MLLNERENEPAQITKQMTEKKLTKAPIVRTIKLFFFCGGVFVNIISVKYATVMSI